MSTIYEKATENAINLVSWVQSVIKILSERGRDAERYGSSFRTRARSFPELMESSGLLPTCTYFYAEATEEVYREVCELLDCEGINAPDVEELSKIKEEVFGYAVFLHGILKFLELVNLIKDHRHPVNAIKELNETNRLALARSFILPYIIEVKKLSEALFKSERE